MHIYIYFYLSISLSLYIYIYMSISVCIYTCVYIYVYIYICLHVYIFIHMYTNMFMYIYIHIFVLALDPAAHLCRLERSSPRGQRPRHLQHGRRNPPRSQSLGFSEGVKQQSSIMARSIYMYTHIYTRVNTDWCIYITLYIDTCRYVYMDM